MADSDPVVCSNVDAAALELEDASADAAHWRHPKRLALKREEAVLERFTKILTQPDWGEGEVQVISNVSFPQRNTR